MAILSFSVTTNLQRSGRRTMKKNVMATTVFFTLLVGSLAYAQDNKVVVVPLLSRPTSFGASLMSATVQDDGTLNRGSAGTTSSKLSTGNYEVCFPIDLTSCQWLVSPGGKSSTTNDNRAAGVNLKYGTTDCLWIDMTDTTNDAAIDNYFTVLVHCL